jgi:hypothetical protein
MYNLTCIRYKLNRINARCGEASCDPSPAARKIEDFVRVREQRDSSAVQIDARRSVDHGHGWV